MRPLLFVLLCTFAASANAFAAPKALFDNTKSETAGNADWIIDTDQPLPVPDQSTVTQATPRTYWLGANSSYGIDLVKRGYQVATLTTGYGISYGNAGNPYDLSKYDVYIVVEPNNKFSSAESTAIYNYVRDGGGLVLVSDHYLSDRDNDGIDSPRVLNALGMEARWGIRCAVLGDANNNFTQDSGNQTNDLTDPVIYGPDGIADSLSFHNGTSFFINTATNPTVRGLVWMQGVSQSSSSEIMAARLQYGAGRVFLVGDSSPVDDGSAQPGNSSIYDGWGEAAGRDSILMLNATRWATRSLDGTPPAVAVLAPNGGESWDAGSPHAVTWSASDAGGVDSVTVAYSLHGAAGPWVNIARAIANSGTTPWTTPMAYSDSAMVRVTAYDHARNSAADLSNARFTIGASALAVGPAAPRFTFDHAIPNPARGVQQLRFSLPAASPARIEIVDIAGRVVWARELGNLAAGEQGEAWDGSADHGGTAPAGLYFARLATRFGARVQRVARTR